MADDSLVVKYLTAKGNPYKGMNDASIPNPDSLSNLLIALLSTDNFEQYV